MKDFAAGLIAYYNSPARKRAYCLWITRRCDGQTVRGTAWMDSLTVDGDVYYSSSGGSASDVEYTASLAVDNAELRANFDDITRADLEAGLWQVADYELFVVNPDDTSIGRDTIIAGTWGLTTIDRLSFLAELRGRMQSLQNAFGDLIGHCPYKFGDPTTCKFDAVAERVTGTAEGVSPDGTTWRDSARTEPGPAGAVNIVSMTRGTTTTITTDAPVGEPDGGTVTLSDIDGPVLLSGPWTVREPSGNTFKIGADTTDTGLYPDLVSGTATPASGESGFFGEGRMRLDSGLNAVGIWIPIKSSVPGEWTLQQAFPFSVTGTETYTLEPGCDHLETTCRIKWDNLLNYGGEPKVPGNDLMVQVGRQQ